jgi:hypothetical protein
MLILQYQIKVFLLNAVSSSIVKYISVQNVKNLVYHFFCIPCLKELRTHRKPVLGLLVRHLHINRKKHTRIICLSEEKLSTE